MSISLASERRSLAQDEFELVLKSHYPLVEELSRTELVDLARLLRTRRARARDIMRGRRRIARGKAEARGATGDTASENTLAAKKQIFATALKRVNARLAQIKQTEHRARARERLQAALARKQTATPHHPSSDQAAHVGMRPKRGAHRRRVLQAARIGRVSQSVKNAQAARDARTG